MCQTNMAMPAGDVLIQTLSSVLYELSTDRRKVYRIGGDEFVMLIENPVEAEDPVHDRICQCCIAGEKQSGRDAGLQCCGLGRRLWCGCP